MSKNILLASKTYLEQTLGLLDRHQDYVFWIRDREMTRQIYAGNNFEKIWQRDPEIIIKFPLLWLDYLEPSGKDFYMAQLQERHNHNYNDSNVNLIYYQIITPDNSIRYILDNCFKCIDNENTIYIVGVAKKISQQSWEAIDKNKKNMMKEIDTEVEEELFKILKLAFGIVKFKKKEFFDTVIENFQEKILAMPFNFTKRELECLYYLCLGNTAKEIAKIMSISYRTVEIYIDKIREKTQTKNKTTIVAKFSKYLNTANIE